jgi:hypothetical protein
MRSSNIVGRFAALVPHIVVAVGVLCGGCSPVPVASQTPAALPAADCVAADAASPAQDAQVTSLRRSVEMGPLYAVASKSGRTGCQVGRDSTAITITYMFRDGSSLIVRRDPQIEYSNQEARLTSPIDENPVAVLTRAEQASFGDKGCGINWRQPESKPAADDAKMTETVYRGDTCNCQARTRADAAGRVFVLSLRSAC